MGKRRKVEKGKISKKSKREFEILGGTTVAASAFLVISIFLASSLDVVIIRSQQYASVVEAVLVDLANGDRAQNRLDGLTVNPLLQKAAQMKAEDMAKKGYFAHTSPEGIDPWYWFNQAGYTFTYAGENLAVDFSDSDAVNTAWMNSPTHRANLLDQHYTEIGIGIAQGMYQGHLTTFVVQEFGKPRKQVSAPAPTVSEVPENPNTPATASAVSASSQVLGESTVTKTAETQDNFAADQTAANSPTVSVSYASPIAHAVASPNQTLKYMYYAFGAVIIVLLAFATGFEVHIRHLRKAAGAGFLLMLMVSLFIAGTKIVFVDPMVPMGTDMTAAAAMSLEK